MHLAGAARPMVLVLLAALACAGGARAAPTRIVSLDYCADQFVLGLADRGQIAAISRGAGQDDSYFRTRARGLRETRGSLEEVLALKPDLVVRNWGGGPQAARTYARFGVPVLSVGDGPDFVAARRELLSTSAAFGHPARGAALAAAFDARLLALRARAPHPAPRVLYLTAGGATAGRGVLIDAVLSAAGARNAFDGQGWTVLPLEKLVARPPNIVALGFFQSGLTRASAWSPSRHAAWRRALGGVKTVPLPTAAISCAGWFSLDAAETLSRALSAP